MSDISWSTRIPQLAAGRRPTISHVTSVSIKVTFLFSMLRLLWGILMILLVKYLYFALLLRSLMKFVHFSVKGLKKDKEYDFRVRAKNIAGLSEPSDVIGPITPKPKYSK